MTDKNDLIKDKGVIGLVEEYLRLKEAVRKAIKLTSGAKRYDLISSSVNAILSEVEDIVGTDDKPLSIPGDRYSSGHRDRDCWAKLYGSTRDIALAKQKKYFEDFPSAGYGTRVVSSDWVVDEASGKPYYFIHLARNHSCD